MNEACTLSRPMLAGLIEIVGPPAAWQGLLADSMTAYAAGRTILILSPERRMVLLGEGPDAAAPDEAAWHSMAAPAGGRVIDVSHAWRLTLLEGPGARALLERAIELDLHEPAFAPGACLQTLCARVPVILYVSRPDCFFLYVPASYAEWLDRWLGSARMVMSGDLANV